MTTIKQVFLGAAVAGVVAGSGSVLATAVAYAEPSAPDTNSAAGASAGDPSGRDAGPRTRSRANAAAAETDSASDGNTLRGSSRQRTSVRGATESEPLPTAASTSQSRAAKSDPTASPVEQPANDPAPASVDVPAVADEVVASPAPSLPAPAAAVAPVPAVELAAPAAVEEPREAAAVVLTPAPASPAPLPVPLLPSLPVLPVAPASAATVSATSGTNSRVRAASAVAQAAVLTDPPTHVLLIGIDGTNLDKVLEYTWDNPESTGLQELMEAGTTGATSIVGHTTISGPSWSTILTGVWDDKTGVVNNLFFPEPYTEWPTVFNMLEAHDPNIDTAVVADWKYLNDMAAAGGFPADVNIYLDVADYDGDWAVADQAVTDKTVELINAADVDSPTFLFSYLAQVDEAGHCCGGASPEYKQAVLNAGNNVAQIMDAVAASEASGVDWTVIVTTDHGHQQSKGLGHGFQSPNETASFVIFDEAGDPAGGLQNQSYSNVDVTPTIVSLFGAPLRSDFDGAPMTSKTSGIEYPADLPTSLDNAISMYGYPNIGTDVSLAIRTVFATVPYVLNGLFSDVSGFLQNIADQDIFLISGLAGVTQLIVEFSGDLVVGVTQVVARGVGWLTGSGTIAPTDPPLTTAEYDSGFVWQPVSGGWSTRLT